MASLSSSQQYKLKTQIKELSEHKGKHTELVSVYIPQGYDINKIIQHLTEEQGTASNIKSATTRKNVTQALEKMIQHLKLYKKTPENGLAIFSGNIASQEGKQDFKVWAIEPALPLNTRIYKCDKEFVTEPLEEMLASKNVYGLVVMDIRDATIALLKGKTIVTLAKTHSEVPGKMRAGGQSAPRFQRLREGATKQHYKKVADYMKNEFLNMEGLKGIIIGGPGTTINNFLNKGYITGDVQNKIIGTKDLSYTDEFGLQELLEKSSDLLAQESVIEEKELMQKFFTLLAKKPELTTYGLEYVKEAIKMGAVDTAIVSEETESSVVEELEELAKEQGSELKIISTETREGVQLREIGKVAAILRFAVDI